MKEHDENIERLIVRSLDGELSADEQLELDRELIRNPQARRLMADYRGIDHLARAALDDMAEAGFTLKPCPAAAPVRGRRVRAFWLIPGAVAAALLALVVPKPLFDSSRPTQPPTVGVAPHWPDMVQPVSSHPSVHRATGRDLVGVIGQDGNVYWIEVERTRTVRLPHGKDGPLVNQF